MWKAVERAVLSTVSGALRTGSVTFEATLWQNLDHQYAK